MLGRWRFRGVVTIFPAPSPLALGAGDISYGGGLLSMACPSQCGQQPDFHLVRSVFEAGIEHVAQPIPEQVAADDHE